MRILNLTQHNATKDQIEAGVIDLRSDEKMQLVKLLTFDSLPTGHEIEIRAQRIATLAASHNFAVSDDDELAEKYDACMIGGAPFLMSALEAELKDNFFKVLYAFSVRESVEEKTHDGSVRKVNTFKHIGFVEV